jgi:hypothetical protein
MKKRSAATGLVILALLSLPVLASAEGTTCSNPTFIVPDGRTINSSIPTGVTFAFVFFAQVGKSYAFEVSQTTSAYGTSPGTISAFSDAPTCATALTVRNVTTVDPDLGQTGPQVGDRVAFNGTNSFVGLRINNTSGVTVNYSFALYETTQYSPTWSTNGAFDTFWSFFNTTNGTCSITLSLTTTAGASAGNTTISVPANRNASTNTVALATARNLAGNARMTTDCPQEAILVEAAVASFSVSPPYIQVVKFQPQRAAR